LATSRWQRIRPRIGEFILAMDGDLQHDPNDIPAFLESWKRDTTWCRLAQDRIDNFVMRRIPSACANWLMARLSASTFTTLVRHSSVSPRSYPNIPLYGEMHRFIPRSQAGMARRSVKFR